MKRTLILVTTMLLPFSVNGQDTNGDGFASMLVPIAFSNTQILTGAYGTRWTNEIWFANNSSTDIQGLQPTNICAPICLTEFPAGAIGRITSVESNKHNGAMLHVPVEVGKQFQISTRLLELSRNSQPTGVEIPVVHEPDFFRGERWLLGVPSGNEVRVALRVYDPRALIGTAVSVDFVAPDGAVIGTTILRPGDDPRLQTPDAITRPVLAPTVASSLNMISDFPVLQAHERFHLRLRPLQEGREYWAMVSVTHNETQHVLLITSQP